MMEAFLSWAVSNCIFAGLLAAAAFLVSRSMRNPHWAHGLWLLVLLKLVTPPIYVVETSWFQKSPQPEPIAQISGNPIPGSESLLAQNASDTEILPAVADEEFSATSIEDNEIVAIPIEPQTPLPSPGRAGLLQVAVLLWGLGTVVCGGLVVLRCWRFHRLLALAKLADGSLQEDVLRLSRQLGMKRGPKAYLIDAQVPPLVWGLFRGPRILLPRTLFAVLTPQQRLTVLAHELAHIRRRDHLFRWIEVGVVVVFWWYPIAWWASREMRRAEEQCCDALVIWALPESRQSYWQALCQTIEFLAATRVRIPEVVGGTMSARPLKRRIEMIMHQKTPHRMSWKSWAAMLLIAAAALPVVAQNAPPKEPPPSQEPDAPTPPAPPRKNSESPAAKSQPPAKDSAESLPTELPRFQPEDAVSASAVLKPSSDVQISSPHSGLVIKVHVSEGDKVKKGQILVELNNTETKLRHQEALGELTVQAEKAKSAELAVRLAQAALGSAKDKLAHSQRMKEKNFVSDIQVRMDSAALNQTEIQLEKAQSEAKAAALMLSTLKKREQLAALLVQELTIRAPVDGVVLDVQVTAGELVEATDALARIVSLNPLVAEALVHDARGLKGKTVVVQILVGKDQVQRPAKVTFVSPVAEPATGGIRIRCLFNNTDRDGQMLARPGQYATVIIPKK